MASRKRIRIELSEDDLADVLGYWSKGESIPVEVEITGKAVQDREATSGPGGVRRGDLIRSSRRWLEEEGLATALSGDEMEVSFPSGQILRLVFDQGRSTTIRCRIDLAKEDLGWLRRLEREELVTLIEDLDTVLGLKPHDSRIIWQSSLPIAIEVSGKIYADGFTKDRLMSVATDISRSAQLAYRVLRVRSGMTGLARRRERSADLGV